MSLAFSPPLCLCLSLSLCMSFSLSLSVSLSVSMPVYLSVSLSLSPSRFSLFSCFNVSLSLHPSRSFSLSFIVYVFTIIPLSFTLLPFRILPGINLYNRTPLNRAVRCLILLVISAVMPPCSLTRMLVKHWPLSALVFSSWLCLV